MERGPLAGVAVAGASWPAAQEAIRLLVGLGATLSDTESGSRDPDSAISFVGGHVDRAPTNVDEDWADSGLAALCGRADGPPLIPTGAPATVARAAGIAIEALGGGQDDLVSSLGQRAAALGGSRQGAVSVRGFARLLRVADGWIVLNLPRQSDEDLVPALLEEPVDASPWPSIAGWCASRTGREVVARARLLGLACGTVPRHPHWEGGPPWRVQRLDRSPPASAQAHPRATQRPLRVVNLGALWAAPLCAQLLHRAGLAVTDVESAARRDNTPREFYNALRAGHDLAVIDFHTTEGLRELTALIAKADVVIEASRPRALRALGLDAKTVMADGQQRTWIRITGHADDTNAIAFGDDAAASGGLVAWDEAGPVFVGDAIADPITGVLAALAGLACVRAAGQWVVDISMTQASCYASTKPA